MVLDNNAGNYLLDMTLKTANGTSNSTGSAQQRKVSIE